MASEPQKPSAAAVSAQYKALMPLVMPLVSRRLYLFLIYRLDTHFSPR